ncbi:hypothetical protein Hamer_G001614 [Homarus americanus]|uniref:Uncharacterized protein n=1 Tax=Homarus americanus TaxID=6706 RepID=A0A8J5MR92_HOMAM|nr:hypothetical protein Hamer_G001614 [Homarus americanus]
MDSRVSRVGVGEATRKTGGGVGSSGFVDLKVMPPAAHTPVPNQSPLSDGQAAGGRQSKMLPALAIVC